MNGQTAQKPDFNTTEFLAISRNYFDLPPAEKRQLASKPQVIDHEQPRISPLQLFQPMNRSTMKHYRRLAKTLIFVSGLGVFVAAPAFAEMTCSEMNGQGNQHERHTKQMDQHHKVLHQALKLTPKQEPGWQRLIDSELPKATANAVQSIDWEKLTAPERAEKMLELTKIRQDLMAEHVAALKAFYASLTPEQQKAFEDAHAAPRSALGMKKPINGPPA
jgi:Spy/CpxP family protein refolding chaperone